MHSLSTVPSKELKQLIAIHKIDRDTMTYEDIVQQYAQLLTSLNKIVDKADERAKSQLSTGFSDNALLRT